MCDKCLQRSIYDEDEWLPTKVGGKLRWPKQRQGIYNLNKIRFGERNTLPGWKRRPNYNRDERIEYDPEKVDYTAHELEQLADQLLRDDSNEVDPETGKRRGIGGENPILFPEHIYQRQRREILNENGIPEPGLVRGIYDRTHPEGRKVNSESARRRHGASWYR